MRREAALQRVPPPTVIDSDLPIVLASAVGPSQRTKLIDALRGRAVLEFCATFDDLSARLQVSSEAIDTVVLPACDVNGQDASRAVREIAAGRPRTAIVVWCD